MTIQSNARSSTKVLNPASAGTVEVVSTHGVPMCTEFGLADY